MCKYKRGTKPKEKKKLKKTPKKYFNRKKDKTHIDNKKELNSTIIPDTAIVPQIVFPENLDNDLEEEETDSIKIILAKAIKKILVNNIPIPADQANTLLELYRPQIEDDTRRIKEAKEQEIQEQREQGTLYCNKGKTGHPTLYKPWMCIHVIQSMSVGKGIGEACIEMGLLKMTALNISEREPNFFYALNIGMALSNHWWKQQGRLNIHNKEFNSTLYMMNMQNRFGWSRKVEGSIKQETISRTEHTERRELVVKNGNTSNEHTAEVIRILSEAGYFQSEPKQITDAEAE